MFFFCTLPYAGTYKNASNMVAVIVTSLCIRVRNTSCIPSLGVNLDFRQLGHGSYSGVANVVLWQEGLVTGVERDLELHHRTFCGSKGR